jgi:hypothetical protein
VTSKEDKDAVDTRAALMIVNDILQWDVLNPVPATYIACDLGWLKDRLTHLRDILRGHDDLDPNNR